MKKKYREITVDGVKYAWVVSENGWVDIFKDKERIYEDCAYCGAEVTPSLIRETILIHLNKPELPNIIHILTRYEENAILIDNLQQQNRKYFNILYCKTDADTIEA